MARENNICQRLVRKGAMTTDTYALFSKWNDDLSFEENLLHGLSGMYQTASWEKEVLTTIRRRFRGKEDAQQLIKLAQAGLPFEEWCSCLLLWISIHEELYLSFAVDWLFPEFIDGRFVIRGEDVSPFVFENWPRLNPGVKSLSDYGVKRTALDLIRMATDLGILSGTRLKRNFATFHLSDRCFIYWAQRIAEYEGSTSKVITSPIWRTALMRPADVERELLRLHQFRKLDYQAAGSLVELTLPCSSASHYAEVMIK
ncbi:hypothetical protein JCM17380_47370 [Desulfosporosinus burensis]